MRTAHLERFKVLEPAAVLFASTNYDFDERLVEGLDVQQFGSARDLFRRLFRAEVEILEINEPLMLSAVKHALVAVLAVRLRGLLRRRRTTIVSYAIENLDPFTTTSARLRSTGRRRAYAVAVRLVVWQIDRLAFGTPGAEDLYRPLLGGFGGESELVPALSTACTACEVHEWSELSDSSGGVLFLGAFDERKGLRQLLAAWPHVLARVPEARLRIVGKGPLQPLAEDFVHDHAEASLIVDPPRPEIHRHLRESAVLVLLSQPTPTWREQVGLPIVEGLAHGCEVVTSTETGIADWLAQHGHRVLTPGVHAEELASAVVDALTSARPHHAILADLPLVDGRLEADRWMFREGR